MSTYIGIDVGTTSVKLLLVDEDGKILNTVSRAYPVYYPKSGWSEQNPEDWFMETLMGIKSLTGKTDKSDIRAIGVSGQMHGLVALDGEDKVIRPAILWNDGRTERETRYLNETIGREKLSECTANIAFAGFTAPKVMWLRENERDSYDRIRRIMLPKDYVVYRLTGENCSDFSDASGTLFLDVKNRCWSGEMCDICGVKTEWLPKLFESYEPVGKITRDMAETLGLSSDVVVCAGAGDNAAAAVGTGAVMDGDCDISIGTSGTVFISRDTFGVDEHNALHSFAHANGRYHLLGCILSAASCNSWWMENILCALDYETEQEGLEKLLGANDVYFLPYLMGERSPHNDVNAKAAFIGMRPDTSRGQMTLAVLEGVAFALRDCVEIAKAGGLTIPRTKFCGGGARSGLWTKILANVLNIPVDIPNTEEGPAYGAAVLAMTAYGAYPCVEDAVKRIVRTRYTVNPNSDIASSYEERYKIFSTIYPALKGVFSSF